MKFAMLFVPVIMCYFLLNSCEDEETEPRVMFSSKSLVFEDSESQVLHLTINKRTTAEFTVISYPDWVTVYPASGYLDTDVSNVIISPDLESMEPGIYEGELVIFTSFNGNETIDLKAIVGEFLSYSTTDNLHFSVFSDDQDLTITNTGNVSIPFTATTSNNLISLSDASGNIAVGNSGIIAVTVNRSSLLSGTYNSDIYLNINGELDTVSVTIDHFKEQKISVQSEIIDAEFSKPYGKIVYVGMNPMALTIFDISDKTFKEIPLNYIPLCVSVSPDGTHAVVGHDGKISYIDLINEILISSMDVPCNVSDIVLGSNGWAYAVPNEYSNGRIECVNLSDRTFVPNKGYSIYQGKIKLHPSGKYIYFADNNISPADLRKFSIESDTAILLYDSPYHGDYPSGGDLWFSEDGLRIFTKPGSVFKASELKALDLLYNGKIVIEGNSTPSYNKIQWLDHSSIGNNLFVISTGDWYDLPNLPVVLIYNANNLIFKDKIDLEKFMVPDGQGSGVFYNPVPYFVFSDITGDKIYVLSKGEGSGLINEWAIEEIAVSLD